MKKPIIQLYSDCLGNPTIWSPERVLIIELTDLGMFRKLTVVEGFQSSKPYEVREISKHDFFSLTLNMPFEIVPMMLSFFDSK